MLNLDRFEMFFVSMFSNCSAGIYCFIFPIQALLDEPLPEKNCGF